MKVHGSLDVFRDSLTVVSVPLQSELPVGLTPEIITPGRSKYEAILKGIPRQVLSVADSKISQARGFLCIGYGFNDTQVQENILTQIRRGVPIVVLTKRYSSMQRTCSQIMQNSIYLSKKDASLIPQKSALTKLLKQ